jgi:hypothetical protein
MPAPPDKSKRPVHEAVRAVFGFLATERGEGAAAIVTFEIEAVERRVRLVQMGGGPVQRAGMKSIEAAAPTLSKPVVFPFEEAENIVLERALRRAVRAHLAR